MDTVKSIIKENKEQIDSEMWTFITTGQRSSNYPNQIQAKSTDKWYIKGSKKILRDMAGPLLEDTITHSSYTDRILTTKWFANSNYIIAMRDLIENSPTFRNELLQDYFQRNKNTLSFDEPWKEVGDSNNTSTFEDYIAKLRNNDTNDLLHQQPTHTDNNTSKTTDTIKNLFKRKKK